MDLDYRIIVGNTGSKINMAEKELSEIKDRFEDELERKNQKEANRIIHKVLDSDQFGQESHRYLKMYT